MTAEEVRKMSAVAYRINKDEYVRKRKNFSREIGRTILVFFALLLSGGIMIAGIEKLISLSRIEMGLLFQVFLVVVVLTGACVTCFYRATSSPL